MLLTSFAQGKGIGKGGGRGQGQGQGQVMGQGQAPGGGQVTKDQLEHNRIKATRQQRDQLRSCDKLANDVRKQTRKMAKDSGKNLNPSQLTQQPVHVRNQMRIPEECG
jgi:hypothetical protein